jgi:hypothetical protein
MHDRPRHRVDRERVVQRLDREPFFDLLEVTRFCHEIIWSAAAPFTAFTADRAFRRHPFPGRDIVRRLRRGAAR